ncbi:MAG: aminotransferase class I/II-fold pyridoxal phosphate-dependent enzyme [Ectothiorhodospiraceae bacterium]|nr:aminotransferase class I/II-fold pyridoxal phosphate-dependent enzyme [Chromatiales bacterium]MCP5156903.1 aminotransferase class I/II-fold pyridoxal phosphate-dependent enzyme [Ectothiorhodospiraceae bacterium]
MRYASIVRRLDSKASRAWAIHAAAARRQAAGEDVILLSIGDPDFGTPVAVVERAFEALRAGRTRYGGFAGDPALREAVARQQTRIQGREVAPDEVTIFVGAQNALYAAARCLVESGDEAVVFDPGYVTYEGVVAATGATRVDVLLDASRGFHLDPERLRAAITSRTRMLLLNTPHNPTGMVMRAEELAAIAELAREHDLWVVADEVYADLVFDVPHVSIASLPGMAERSVVVGSVSKSHAMQGWRIGWTVAPRELTGHLTNLIKPMHYGTAPFVQDAAAFALSTDLEEVGLMRAAYRRRRDLVWHRLEAVPGLRCSPPEGSMFLFVDVRGTGLDGEAFAEGLLDFAGVSLLPGSGFGPSVVGYVRLSLSAPEAVLERACDRIERYVEHLRRGAAGQRSGR